MNKPKINDLIIAGCLSLSVSSFSSEAIALDESNINSYNTKIYSNTPHVVVSDFYLSTLINNYRKELLKPIEFVTVYDYFIHSLKNSIDNIIQDDYLNKMHQSEVANLYDNVLRNIDDYVKQTAVQDAILNIYQPEFLKKMKKIDLIDKEMEKYFEHLEYFELEKEEISKYMQNIQISKEYKEKLDEMFDINSFIKYNSIKINESEKTLELLEGLINSYALHYKQFSDELNEIDSKLDGFVLYFAHDFLYKINPFLNEKMFFSGNNK
jgi:hypothetical protein